jgi:flagellin
MPLGILNNIPSLAAENELTLTSTALNSTLEQLASGSRINSGADDPAGLAIANGLQANISALTQSVSNANDGVGELQLADGALAQVTNLLNTAITLATESATGTVSNEQRTAIQAQYASILAEINQIGTATTYNGQAVFQSGSAPNLNAQNSPQTAALTLTTALTATDTTSVTAGGQTFTFTAAGGNTVQTLLNAINDDTTVGAKAVLSATGTIEITDPLNRGDLAVSTTDTVLGAPVAGAPTAFTTPNTVGTATINTNELVSNIGGLTADSLLTTGDVTSFTAGGKTFSFTATGLPGAATVGDLITAINNPGTDAAGLQAYIGTSGSATGQLVVIDPNNNNNVAIGSTNTETALGTFTDPATTGSTATNIFLSDSTAIGSSQIAVTIGGLSAASITDGNGGEAVNLATTDLSTQSDAQTALTLINSAISNVASVRGTLGASVNRLTAASNVINSQVQNLTSAENTITAADIPTVVANLTKYSILEQTGISALAQANQQQQLVLKLLQ